MDKLKNCKWSICISIIASYCTLIAIGVHLSLFAYSADEDKDLASSEVGRTASLKPDDYKSPLCNQDNIVEEQYSQLMNNIEAISSSDFAREFIPVLKGDYNIAKMIDFWREGICLSLAILFVTTKDLNSLKEKLVILTRNPEDGWDFFDHHYCSLKDALEELGNQYKKWRSEQSYLKKLKDDCLGIDCFAAEIPLASQLIEISAFLELIAWSQTPECINHAVRNTFHTNIQNYLKRFSSYTKLIGTSKNITIDSSSIFIFKPEYLEKIIQKLNDGIYTLGLSEHITTFTVLKNKVVFFDQKILGFFYESENVGEFISEFWEELVLSKFLTLRKHTRVSDNTLKENQEFPFYGLSFEGCDAISQQDFLDMLIVAIEEDDIVAVKNIIINIEDVSGLRYSEGGSEESIIFLAINVGNTEIIRLLLDSGATFDQKNNDGLTPIEVAYEYRVPEVISILLKHGHNANQVCQNEEWLLEKVCSDYNRTEELSILLQNGANPNIRCKNGMWLLERECDVTDHSQIVELLLKYEANPNITCLNGMKLLEKECCRLSGNFKIISLLLDYGADPNITCQDGLKLVDKMCDEYAKDKEIICLLEAGVDANQVCQN